MTKEVVQRLTAAMRLADSRFAGTGGTTRSRVRDYLAPAIEEQNLSVVDAELYNALVEAVRAYLWQGESLEHWPDPTNEVEQTAKKEREGLEYNQTENALDRAAIMLAEHEGR